MPLKVICSMPHDALERVFLVEVVCCSSTKCFAVWRNLGISGDNVQCMGFWAHTMEYKQVLMTIQIVWPLHSEHDRLNLCSCLKQHFTVKHSYNRNIWKDFLVLAKNGFVHFKSTLWLLSQNLKPAPWNRQPQLFNRFIVLSFRWVDEKTLFWASL